jgi:ubiquinone biosynthesis protein
LIDFGQTGTLSPDLMTDLVVLTYACVNREIDMVVETFADMDALTPRTDHRGLRRAMQLLLDKYYGLPLKRLDVGPLFNEFNDVIRRHDVVIPRDLALLIKALSTVGTLARRLDPDLNMLELLGPRVKAALHERFSPKEIARATTKVGWDLLSIVRRAPGQLRGLLRRMSSHGWELHVRHENIDNLIKELDRSSNRIAFSVVIAAIIVGSSVVFSAGTDMTLFGVRVQYFGIVGYLIAGLLGLGLTWAIFRSGRLH